MTDEVPLFRNWLRRVDDEEVATEFKKRTARASPQTVARIKKELGSAKTLKQIAHECNVTYMTVYNINRRHTHKEK